MTGHVRYLVAAGLCAVSMATRAAQPPASLPKAVSLYRTAVTTVRSMPEGTGVEAAFRAFLALRAVLMRHDGLEALTEPQFAEVRALKGVIVSRDEAIYVQPDVAFFSTLARSHGDAADRAFFAALQATYPDSVWATYIEQQTDVGGCTRFGSLEVAAAYIRWADFRRQFPTRYREEARKEADAALQALTASTCACGEAVTVERELEQALRGIRGPTARARVQARLQAVRAGRVDIEPHCTGGR